MDKEELLFSVVKKKVNDILEKICEENAENSQNTLSDVKEGDVIEISSQHSEFGQPVIRQVLVIDLCHTKSGGALLRYIDLDPSITHTELSRNITKTEKLGHIDQIEELKRLIFNY